MIKRGCDKKKKEWLRGERVEDGNGEDDLKLKLGEKYLICNLTSHW